MEIPGAARVRPLGGCVMFDFKRNRRELLLPLRLRLDDAGNRNLPDFLAVWRKLDDGNVDSSIETPTCRGRSERWSMQRPESQHAACTRCGSKEGAAAWMLSVGSLGRLCKF